MAVLPLLYVVVAISLSAGITQVPTFALFHMYDPISYGRFSFSPPLRVLADLCLIPSFLEEHLEASLSLRHLTLLLWSDIDSS